METKVKSLPAQYEYKVTWFSEIRNENAVRLVFATSVIEAADFAERLFGELFYGPDYDWEIVAVRRRKLLSK